MRADPQTSSPIARQNNDGAAKLSVLDLFSGVGSYSLGLERTGGFRTVAFCEIEEYPRKILRKHWPDVRIYEDVRELSAARLAADGIVPRWIVAGWPCQGNSPAGTGLGMDDPRSGLWAEIARLASELGVEGLILENSSNLLNINGGRDFGRVLGDLAALGLDAEWHCLPAAAFDAWHIRDRVWIVATRPDADGKRAQVSSAGRQPAIELPHGIGEKGAAANVASVRQLSRRTKPAEQPRRPVAHGNVAPANAHSIAPIGTAIARAERHTWEPEPDVVRVVHGCPDRVDRVHALGNLNPPIVPYTIGRAILQARAA
jgi:DNA (cytosine-5)-methyltransferase 1